MAITNARLYKNEPTATLYNYPAGDGSTDGSTGGGSSGGSSTGITNTDAPFSQTTSELTEVVNNITAKIYTYEKVGRLEYRCIEKVRGFDYEDILVPYWSVALSYLYNNITFKAFVRFRDNRESFTSILPQVEEFKLIAVAPDVIKIISLNPEFSFAFRFYTNIYLDNNVVFQEEEYRDTLKIDDFIYYKEWDANRNYYRILSLPSAAIYRVREI